MHARELRVRVEREKGVDPHLGRIRVDRQGHQLHAGDALGREDHGPARADRRNLGGEPRSPPRVRVSRSRRDRLCRRKRRAGRASRRESRSAPPFSVWGAISPSRKAPSAARSAAIEKQLSTRSPGCPNARQATSRRSRFRRTCRSGASHRRRAGKLAPPHQQHAAVVEGGFRLAEFGPVGGDALARGFSRRARAPARGRSRVRRPRPCERARSKVERAA